MIERTTGSRTATQWLRPIDRYAAATGRDLSNLAFYCVLGLFKLACVMEGSYARFTAGTSDDAMFAFLETVLRK